MQKTPSKELSLPRRILPFGPHKGDSIRTTSHRWLSWLARQTKTMEFIHDEIDWVLEARSELARRGTSYDSIPPSYHAIDRFSCKYLHKWTEREVGLSTFIAKLGDAAWVEGKTVAIDKDLNKNLEIVIQKYFDGITFVFHCDRNSKPLCLKTIK